MLDPTAVRDLQALWRQEFATKLSEADAHTLGNRLLELFSLLTQQPEGPPSEAPSRRRR